jgi:hypothetical protein
MRTSLPWRRRLALCGYANTSNTRRTAGVWTRSATAIPARRSPRRKRTSVRTSPGPPTSSAPSSRPTDRRPRAARPGPVARRFHRRRNRTAQCPRPDHPHCPGASRLHKHDPLRRRPGGRRPEDQRRGPGSSHPQRLPGRNLHHLWQPSHQAGGATSRHDMTDASNSERHKRLGRHAAASRSSRERFWQLGGRHQVRRTRKSGGCDMPWMARDVRRDVVTAAMAKATPRVKASVRTMAGPLATSV